MQASSTVPLSPSRSVPAHQSRLNFCNQCESNLSRYTCPACSVRTCSLACSQKHKVETKCTGKRDRVKYVPMNQYSWGSLAQDYSYLEEVNRLLTAARDSKSVDSVESLAKPLSRKSLAKRRNLLKQAAIEGVHLSLLPEGMARRKLNVTYYNQQRKALQWTVEMFFPTISKESLETSHSYRFAHLSSHLAHQISPQTTILDILKQVLKAKKLNVCQATKSSLAQLVEKAEANICPDSLTFVLRIENVSRTQTLENVPCVPQVRILDGKSLLSEGLKGSMILEWPKIEVWGTTDWQKKVDSGAVQVLPKGNDDRSDSGWHPKRICRRSSAASASTVNSSLENTQVDEPTLMAEAQFPGSASTGSPPAAPEIVSSLNCLLDYGSSDAESAC